MPTYVYKRADGTTFEIQQKMTEPALETCPTTGQPVKRQIGAGAGLIFKGDGFYITDYARKGRSGDASESASNKPEAQSAEKSSTDSQSADTSPSSAKTETSVSGNGSAGKSD